MPAGPRPLQPTFLLVECRWNKDGYKSGAILTEGGHYIRPVCSSRVTLRYACLKCSQLYQICMMSSFIHICVFVNCCSIRQGIWSVTNPSSMPTGRVLLPRICIICWLPSWTHLEYISNAECISGTTGMLQG